MSLIIANDPVQPKTQVVGMCINLTTDANQKREEFILDSSNSDQQQTNKNVSQETKTGVSNKSQESAVHSNMTSSPQPSGMTHTLDNISNNEQPKRYQTI